MDYSMSILPKVYIIIVNYNGVNDTIECIDSLRKITYSNYQVVIVDNASTDDSYNMLRKYVINEVILIAEYNGGFSAGNNIGIRYSIEQNADYCLLLNNDTTVEPNFLSILVDSAEKKRGSVLTSKILMYDDKTRIWYAGGVYNSIFGRTIHRGIGDLDEGQYNHGEKVSFVSGCCMLLPISIINSIGLMDEKYFLYCEDLAYCLDILNAGYDLFYEPSSVIYHKVGSSSGKTTNTTVYYTVRNKCYVINKYSSHKYISMLYHYVECTKRIIFGEYSLRTVFNAFKDYRSNLYGIKS